jgi:NAD dependent epimerase/dehydratase family
VQPVSTPKIVVSLDDSGRHRDSGQCLPDLEVFDLRVFVVGACGHIGSALVPEPQAAGHQVIGLARSDASADKLDAARVGVRRGDLDDLDVIGKAAADADGVIHLADKRDLKRTGVGHIRPRPVPPRSLSLPLGPYLYDG